MLFARGEVYEQLPPPQQAKVSHHLREIVVVLTKGLISDQLGFVGIAKDLFSVSDLQAIRRRRIGRGEPHADVEDLLLSAQKLTHLAALVLFDDMGRAADVMTRINKEGERPAPRSTGPTEAIPLQGARWASTRRCR